MNLVATLSRSPWISGFKTVACQHERCRRWLTQRALETRRVGITFEEKWYCSYRCLAARLHDQVAEQLGTPRRWAEPAPRMPLGLMLMDKGVISEEQLRQASLEQKHRGADMGEILVELGFLGEREMVAARASQWGCPVFTVTPECEHVNATLPPTLMRQCQMVPLHYARTTKKLLVGFVQAIDYAMLYAIEQNLGCKTHPCFIRRSEMEAQFQTLVGHSGSAEQVYDDLADAEEMTRAICSQGVAIQADVLSLVRYRGYLWARCGNGGAVRDVLIAANRSVSRATVPLIGAA